MKDNLNININDNEYNNSNYQFGDINNDDSKPLLLYEQQTTIVNDINIFKEEEEEEEDEEQKDKKNKFKSKYDINPEENANIFSILTFSFLNRLMRVGLTKALDFKEAYPVHDRDASKNVYRSFEKHWNNSNNNTTPLRRESTDADTHNNIKPSVLKKKSLLRVLNSNYGWYYHSSFIFKVIGDSCEFVYPLMIYKLTNFIQDPTEPYWHGIIYSSVLLLSYVINQFAISYWEYRCSIVAFKSRTSLINAIYLKSLKISNSVREKGNKGKGNTMNLISVDVDYVKNLFEYSQYIISAPIQLLLSLFLLFKLLSWSALIGYGSLLIFLPLNFLAAMKHSKISEEVMKRKDARTSQITEAINGIRLLKFNGWLDLMFEKIMMLRKDEVSQIKKMNIVIAFLYLFWSLLPDFLTVSTFSSYALLGNQLNISTIITALAILFIARFPLSILPHLISGTTLSMVSLRRIEAFLLNEELEVPLTNLLGTTTYGIVDDDFDQKEIAISIRNASFQWSTIDDDKKEDDNEKKENDEKKHKEKEKLIDIQEIEKEKEEKIILNNINLEFKIGSQSAIIGSIGSGKSSLLSAILGDMRLMQDGGLSTRGTFAYTTQLPWIMNGTIKENIVFGNHFDQDRYDQVLISCCLEHDLTILPGGDLCEIGEKGINLSGGQKQRIAIARSIYSDADIYLFDDPLASLDVEVANKVFFQAINTLKTRNKTVLLVTHQLFPLEHCDQIITIDNGIIQSVGTFQEMDRSNWEVYTFNSPTNENDKDEDDDDEDEDDEDTENGELVGDEDRNVGKVTLKDYITYIKSIGKIYITLSFILSVVPPAFSVFGNYWLSRWSEEWQNQGHASLLYYLGIYFSSAMIMSFGIFAVTLVNAFGGLNASQNFHKTSLYRVLHSPIQFFDQNLSGRIINRFSKDISTLDNELPYSIGEGRDCLLNVVSVIVMIALGTPVVLITLIPISVALWVLKNWYLSSARELQRLSSVSLSPVLTHFSETLSGQSIIRAFRAGDRFAKDMMTRVDVNTSISLCLGFVSQWANLRLSMICLILVFTTCLSATFLRDHLSPALLGLAITYSVTLSGEMNWMFIMFTNVETQMNSLERLNHYTQLNVENQTINTKSNHININHCSDWKPTQGKIVFNNYSMKYRDELAPSLEDINLEIQGKSKVAICGRTGSGKSTLAISLFRLVEACQGSIEIDGQDISQIPLNHLRSQLSIIPQDPVLFAGTLRYNLDPFDNSTDAEMWDMIERVNLSSKIKSLDTKVSEDATNFSVGERQLLCLARALIRQCKIIIMDEATAAVDMATDEIIQQTIRTSFKDCTVITIAHRLNTIIDYDTVILLSGGKVLRQGNPSDIIQLIDQDDINHNNNNDDKKNIKSKAMNLLD